MRICAVAQQHSASALATRLSLPSQSVVGEGRRGGGLLRLTCGSGSGCGGGLAFALALATAVDARRVRARHPAFQTLAKHAALTGEVDGFGVQE